MTKILLLKFQILPFVVYYLIRFKDFSFKKVYKFLVIFKEMKVIKSLFEGDYEVREGNLYTRVHEYKNKDKQVIFIAVNHGGSKQYYKQIEERLNDCDFVFFEPLSASTEKNDKLIVEATDEKENSLDKILNDFPELKERANKIKNHGKDYSNIFLLDLENAYFLVRKHEKPIKDVYEQTKCLNTQRENWIACEVYNAGLFDKFIINYTFRKEIRNMDKKKLLNLIITELEGAILANQDKLTYKYLIKLFKNGQCNILSINEKITKPFREYSKLREKLKEKLNNKDIRTIGMLFGAGHGPNVRKEIKKLGFKEIKTIQLPVFLNF